MAGPMRRAGLGHRRLLRAPAARRGKNEPGFAEDLCAWLADRRVRAVGTDTAACDVAVRDGKVLSAYGHRQYFLPNDILIIEGLRRLAEVPPEFHFIALPLRLHGGSGSPLRAIAVVADHSLPNRSKESR
jgi:arylformamidase